jgi:hypothetical protein
MYITTATVPRTENYTKASAGHGVDKEEQELHQVQTSHWAERSQDGILSCPEYAHDQTSHPSHTP